MNNYHKIENIITHLQNDYDWSHSFIREFYLVTTRNLRDETDTNGNKFLGDIDGIQNARVVVACSGKEENTGIEFLFNNLGVISIDLLNELIFEYKYDKHAGHCVHFSETVQRKLGTYFTAKEILVRFLGRKYQGINLHLGYEFPSIHAKPSTLLEDNWRQCPTCSNIWQETPLLEFSRCPDCGELTRLKH